MKPKEEDYSFVFLVRTDRTCFSCACLAREASKSSRSVFMLYFHQQQQQQKSPVFPNLTGGQNLSAVPGFNL